MKDTLEGRTIGLLVADGSDAGSIEAIAKAVLAAGANVKRVALNIGDVKLSDGSRLKIDGQLAGMPSVLFDAVAVILSKEAAAMLSEEADAMDFVRDAFGHLKAIGVDKGGEFLLNRAGIKHDAGVMAIGALDRFIAAAKTRQWKREASVRTLA